MINKPSVPGKVVHKYKSLNYQSKVKTRIKPIDELTVELCVSFSPSIEEEVITAVNKTPLHINIRRAGNEKELVMHVGTPVTFNYMEAMFNSMLAIINTAKDMAGMIEKLQSICRTAYESNKESTTK